VKQGTIREDGKIFARIQRGKPLWLTKEQYENREIKRKIYVRKCLELYKKLKKEPKSIGDYDHRKNLYFIGISSSGKEVWRNKFFLDKFKKRQDSRRKEYIRRCSDLPVNNLKFGDQNPDNPNLFVIHKVKNKCFFGNKKKLEEKKESLRIAYAKRHFKSKKKRKINMDNIKVKLKRGAVREQDNYIFFQYNGIGKEVWLAPEIYNEKRNKEIFKRREIRRKEKEAKQAKQVINII
jgi:hypothetical protein